MRWLDTLTGSRSNDALGVSVLKDAPAALAAPTVAFKPSIDRGQMAVTSILTTETPDRQGDVVDPAGGDFSEHETNPVVMFHHGKTHKLPIGKSEDKDGNYTVRLVKARDGSDVLIGTTHFAQSNRFAQDVFGLVAEDVLRGVSIGFDPLSDNDAVEELGQSPTLERSALHFKGWKLLEYSHTPIGVNRDALTQVVHKAYDGSRKLHPVLLKALEPMATPRRTTVSVPVAKAAAPTVRKAMPKPADDDQDEMDDIEADGGSGADADGMDPGTGGGTGPDGGYDPATDDPGDDPALPANYGTPDADSEPPPTVQTLTDGAQGLLDLCSAIEQGMKKSEHMKGRKYAMKLCADLRKTAAEVSQFADRVHSEIKGAPADPGDTGDTEDADGDGDGSDSNEEEAESAPDAPETDDEGAIVKKGYAPRRFLFADAAAVAPVGRPQAVNTRQLKALQRENETLKRSLENLLADIEAGQNRRR